MGYCMEMLNSDFVILPKNKDKALKAILSLAGKETIVDSGGGHFSWVDNRFVNAKTLEAALYFWRWDYLNEDSATEFPIFFVGEKLGDDKILFDAIAPFVKAGSFIEMRGEDGYQWKWVFDGETCKEISGRVVYDE